MDKYSNKVYTRPHNFSAQLKTNTRCIYSMAYGISLFIALAGMRTFLTNIYHLSMKIVNKRLTLRQYNVDRITGIASLAVQSVRSDNEVDCRTGWRLGYGDNGRAVGTGNSLRKLTIHCSAISDFEMVKGRRAVYAPRNVEHVRFGSPFNLHICWSLKHCHCKKV